jgi:hypothetical protein
VVLLRSDNGRRFELDRTLATRPCPADEISLMGSYLLRFSDEIPQVGDYVDIAAAGSRIPTAFIPPEALAPTSRKRRMSPLGDLREGPSPRSTRRTMPPNTQMVPSAAPSPCRSRVGRGGSTFASR